MIQKLEGATYHPTNFVIFGGTGDLSRRKLLPAIYHLYINHLLPDDISFIAVARRDISQAEYRQLVKDSVKTYIDNNRSLDRLDEFVQLFDYVSGVFDDTATYERITQELRARDEQCKMPHQSVFYLATAPQFFIPIIEQLKSADLAGECSEIGVKAKIVIEKPFGHDVETAKALNETVLNYAEEEQIYRMDHYLAKETVQNILLFRFTNPVIRDSWNPQGIDHIQITAAEDLGVEQRAAYYDGAGALRDMVQSHVLALLALVMMDEPFSLESKDIHRSKEAILDSLRLASHATISDIAVRGQYEGYQDIPGVKEDSKTDTYAALRLQSNHPSWTDVPIFIQTGKRMKRKSTTISIHFSPCTSNICSTQGIQTAPNILKIRVQPEEGVTLRLYAKQPGFDIATDQVDMDFFYKNAFTKEQPSPYERLIHDVIVGDQSLFPTTKEVMRQWEIIQPVLDAWASDADISVETYEQASWGPAGAVDLIAKYNGIRWHT